MLLGFGLSILCEDVDYLELLMGHTFNSTISLSFFSTCSFSLDASSLGASSFFSAASPSFAGAASEYHRMAGVAATRVTPTGCLSGAKAGVRRAACLEARRIVLCSMVDSMCE